MTELKKVTIYTDGGCDPNPGPGGYGVVLISGSTRKELSGGYANTTNNRMEMLAVIRGLESLKRSSQVLLHSDSKYVIDSLTKGWLRTWRGNGWRTSAKKPVKNVDLWKQLYTLVGKHQVEFRWVKGHSGIEENEVCDQLASMALRQPDLPVDEGYSEELPQLKVPSSSEHEPPPSAPEDTPPPSTGSGDCRKCGGALERRRPKGRPKPDQAYYYAWYLRCESCGTQYMLEEAKRQNR